MFDRSSTYSPMVAYQSFCLKNVSDVIICLKVKPAFLAELAALKFFVVVVRLLASCFCWKPFTWLHLYSFLFFPRPTPSSFPLNWCGGNYLSRGLLIKFIRVFRFFAYAVRAQFLLSTYQLTPVKTPLGALNSPQIFSAMQAFVVSLFARILRDYSTRKVLSCANFWIESTRENVLTRSTFSDFNVCVETTKD